MVYNRNIDCYSNVLMGFFSHRSDFYLLSISRDIKIISIPSSPWLPIDILNKLYSIHDTYIVYVHVQSVRVHVGQQIQTRQRTNTESGHLYPDIYMKICTIMQ